MRDLLQAGEEMKLQHFGLAVGWVIITSSSYVFAQTTALLGGYAITNGYASPLTGFTIQASKPQLTGGLLLGFDLVDGGGAQIELGFFYMPRGFVEVLNDQSTITVSETTVQAPLLVRVSILPALSLGVGGFFSYALTRTSNLSVSDSGFVGSAAIKFGSRKSANLLLDVRYLFGLTNQSTVPGFATYFYDLQALVGVVLGF